MYDEVIMLLIKSNIGSFVKEDILNNKRIKQEQSDEYYSRLKEILSAKESTFLKERRLTNFLFKD